MSAFLDALRGPGPVLADGGIETRIMFETDYEMDPHLQVAAMVGDPAGHPLIRGVYESYVRAAEAAGLPLVIGTPTFRASRNFAGAAGRGADVAELNRAAAAMQVELRASATAPVFVAGVLGPAGDAYTPAEALGEEDAEGYHAEQAAALASAGVDFLFAATFPAVTEARGVARAMATTGLPYVVSLVLGRDGRVLDGATLGEAIEAIDAAADPQPAHISISCVHTSVAGPALESLERRERLLELKANGSPLPTTELVELDHPAADPPEVFAERMWELHDRFGLRVLGGCCGTDDRHIAALADLATRA
jgi:homocysteine S-methyltransferase